MKTCIKCNGTGQVIDHSEIGLGLRKQRQEAEISQKAMAEAMGIRQNYLCGLETGQRSWSKSRQAKYIDAMASIMAARAEAK